MEESLKNKLMAASEAILVEARKELYLSMRFLDMALSSFGYQMYLGTRSIATDGEKILYHPRFLASQYENDPILVNRAYLHLLLHCMFRHMHQLPEDPLDQEYWNLACDIAVESVIDDLNNRSVRLVVSDTRSETYERLGKQLKVLTAEGIYRIFRQEHLSYDEMVVLKKEFHVCDHTIWENLKNQRNDAQGSGGKQETDGGEEDSACDESDARGAGEEAGNQSGTEETGGEAGSESGEEETGGEAGGKSSEEETVGEAGSESGEGETGGEVGNETGTPEIKGEIDCENCSQESKKEAAEQFIQKLHGQKDGSNSSRPDSQEASHSSVHGDGKQSESAIDELLNQHSIEEMGELEKYWEDICAKTQTNLETVSKKYGEEAKGFLKALRIENRTRYDYRKFLRKFAVRKETMQIDLDGFDYGYYTFGLRQYGNIPLIEPLEYKEENQIEEFAIVIDTSGSCSGELVQRFLKESYVILTSQQTFARKVNLVIIQCDDEVQSVDSITCEEDLKKYEENLVIHGLGGTDFRPSIECVSRMVEEKKFKKLKGLLYFTDGEGTYPKKRPKYEVAFVFLGEEFSDVLVPAWAMKLVIEQEDLS